MTQEISFHVSGSRTDAWSDEEFLRALCWRKSAADKLSKAARQGNSKVFLDAFFDRLPLQDADPAERLLLLRELAWSGSAPSTDAATGLYARATLAGQRLLLAESSRRSSKRAIEELRQSLTEDAPAASWTPWDTLAAMTLLLSLGDELPRDAAMALYRGAVSGVMLAHEQLDLQPHLNRVADQRLMLVGELNWLGALMFGGIRGAHRLQQVAEEFLVNQFLAETDEEGFPSPVIRARWPLWVASIIRSYRAGERFGVRLGNRQMDRRLGACLSRAATLIDAGGQPLFCQDSTATQSWREILGTALPYIGGQRGHILTRARSARPRDREEYSEKHTPAADLGTSGVGVLRSHWRAKANLLAISQLGGATDWAIDLAGAPLVRGRVLAQLQVGDAVRDLEGTWESTCFNSDEDGDYLELRLDAGDGITVERRLFLARDDGFAVVGDCVRGLNPDQAATYRLRLPLAAGVRLWDSQPAGCRHKLLHHEQAATMAVPLSLPQSHVERAAGEMKVTPAAIELTCAVEDPVFSNWLWLGAVSRGDEQAIRWKKLTVADDGVVLPPERAVAYRLRMGARQWMVYHNVDASPWPRSVLGLHTLYEAVIARFVDTEVEPLVQIERVDEE